MNEFECIEAYFAPLTTGEGALSLKDDAALLDIPASEQLVMTKDMLVESVHFLPDTDPALIAKKLVRVNLSDLAAMGARPLGYMVGLGLPKQAGEEWIARFAEGLKEENAAYDIALLGGDTVRHNGVITLSLTAFGAVEKGTALQRNAARPGDVVAVSGTIGDSALGLKVGQCDLSLSEPKQADFLLQRYHLPQPRVNLGMALRPLVHAAMDISDGLLQDMGHICDASGVGAIIYQGDVPLSDAGRTVVAEDASLMETVMTGGDDYELLFTAAKAAWPEVMRIAEALAIPVTQIGHITSHLGMHCMDSHGQPVHYAHLGYQHL